MSAPNRPVSSTTSSSSSSKTPAFSPSLLRGVTQPLPKTENLTSFLFSTPFRSLPNPNSSEHPQHTFAGREINPSRLALYHDGSKAAITRARLREDALKVARALTAIVGGHVRWDDVKDMGPNEAIHSPRTTVMLHLPNCLAFPPLFLGSLAANLTVSPISPMYSASELTYFLAKSRPNVIVTTQGAGASAMREALSLLLDPSHGPDMAKLGRHVSKEEVLQWASEMARDWDDLFTVGKARRGELPLPIVRRRVWLVDLEGKTDYYGSGARGDTHLPAALDRRDWTHLLSPPDGWKRSSSGEPFDIAPMNDEEQRRRAAVLLWSSGTTGTSKGVLLSHRALINGSYTQWLDCPALSGPHVDGGEVWVALAPWYHVYGMALHLISSIAIGATLILPALPRFELEYYLRLLTRYRATFAHIAPPVAVALRNTSLLSSPSIDLSSVKAFFSGGAPVSHEVISDLFRRTGKVLGMGFGTTETVCVSGTTGMDLGTDGKSGRKDELGSAGQVQANIEVRIDMPKAGTQTEMKDRSIEYSNSALALRKKGLRAPLRPSVCGELVIRSPSVMLGYFSGAASEGRGGKSAIDWLLTRDAMTDDGWYRTGDEAVLDASGNVWITGRLKELIKVSGFQVPPAELDSLFAKHSSLADAAAGSIVESSGSEQVVLYVSPRDGSILGDEAKQLKLVADLASWVVGRTAYYKHPRYYVVVPSILKSPTGKVLRKDLHKLPGKRHLAPRVPGAKKDSTIVAGGAKL